MPFEGNYREITTLLNCRVPCLPATSVAPRRRLLGTELVRKQSHAGRTSRAPGCHPPPRPARQSSQRSLQPRWTTAGQRICTSGSPGLECGPGALRGYAELAGALPSPLAEGHAAPHARTNRKQLSTAPVVLPQLPAGYCIWAVQSSVRRAQGYGFVTFPQRSKPQTLRLRRARFTYHRSRR